MVCETALKDRKRGCIHPGNLSLRLSSSSAGEHHQAVSPVTDPFVPLASAAYCSGSRKRVKGSSSSFRVSRIV